MNLKNRLSLCTNRLVVFVVMLLFATGLKAQDTNTQTKSIEDFHTQARIFRHQNKLDKALKALNQASKLAEEKEDLKSLLDTFHKFALLHLEIGDEENTQFYWDRASVLLKDIEYPYGDAVHKYIEASLLFISDNKFQARQKLEESKSLSNDKNLLNNMLLLEAQIFSEMSNYEDASKNFNALLVNSDKNERAFLATQANLGLAQMYKQQGNLIESLKHAEAALELAQKHQFFREILSANTFLTATYAALSDYEKAFKSQNNLITINDSLFTIEKTKLEARTGNKILQQTQTEYIEDLEAKNEELNQSANRSDITAILASAFLTIISILAVSLFRNNQIKLKTNDLLVTKNKELETARDAAISAMEAKTNFLSTVTHELRTPLYAVTGLTHLLLDEDPADHQKEHLKSLKFSGDYLLNFINDILQINKIDADKLEPLNIEFKLKKVLTDVIDSLQQNAKDNNTTIVLDYDNNIPLHLLGDPLKLSQIIMNLVGNALKFTHHGKVEVITKLKDRDEDNLTVYFEVKDSGIGISEEQQKNIFDSFEQGSVQINREYGGTGLGLTIVKSLLGLFDSKIYLESKLDKGSSFFFELNLKCEENSLEDVPFELTVEDFDFDGLHILVVEDNKINQVITKKMLNKKGMSVDIANNGNEAIDAASSKKYDAILMDIHMPGISGTEATIQIRKFDSDIPIIALTAISMDDSLDEFYAAGCNAVVTKPFKPEVFYQKIGENIFKTKIEGEA
ncbi:hybrid sensor histidine kinase/response regulator [Croceitalea vernalis]|uniref:histidine kinase n=1 Tax=Croceitalea vernalis TaxID=3075599 RepID=A0ABU3BL57_9FLAO|nr:response regulator [Croceitalea sp. P007]MDT0622840.1 response regulator [Croceitalea sp. P007]